MTQAAPHSEAARIAQFMGLRGWQDTDDRRLVRRVVSGLPVSVVQTIVKRVDPTGSHLDVHDLVPKSSFYRLKEQKKPLTKEQSERIYALAKVFTEALRQYHDDQDATLLFLSRKHPLLGNRTPLDVTCESTAGADLVLKLLDKADAGVAV